MTKMTTEEAFIKVLQFHGIEHAFGIIGSAFMPISDLFPKACSIPWNWRTFINASSVVILVINFPLNIFLAIILQMLFFYI